MDLTALMSKEDLASAVEQILKKDIHTKYILEQDIDIESFVALKEGDLKGFQVHADDQEGDKGRKFISVGHYGKLLGLQEQLKELASQGTKSKTYDEKDSKNAQKPTQKHPHPQKNHEETKKKDIEIEDADEDVEEDEEDDLSDFSIATLKDIQLWKNPFRVSKSLKALIGKNNEVALRAKAQILKANFQAEYSHMSEVQRRKQNFHDTEGLERRRRIIDKTLARRNGEIIIGGRKFSWPQACMKKTLTTMLTNLKRPEQKKRLRSEKGKAKYREKRRLKQEALAEALRQETPSTSRVPEINMFVQLIYHSEDSKEVLVEDCRAVIKGIIEDNLLLELMEEVPLKKDEVSYEVQLPDRAYRPLCSLKKGDRFAWNSDPAWWRQLEEDDSGAPVNLQSYTSSAPHTSNSSMEKDSPEVTSPAKRPRETQRETQEPEDPPVSAEELSRIKRAKMKSTSADPPKAPSTICESQDEIDYASKPYSGMRIRLFDPQDDGTAPAVAIAEIMAVRKSGRLHVRLDEVLASKDGHDVTLNYKDGSSRQLSEVPQGTVIPWPNENTYWEPANLDKSGKVKDGTETLKPTPQGPARTDGAETPEMPSETPALTKAKKGENAAPITSCSKCGAKDHPQEACLTSANDKPPPRPSPISRAHLKRSTAPEPGSYDPRKHGTSCPGPLKCGPQGCKVAKTLDDFIGQESDGESNELSSSEYKGEDEKDDDTSESDAENTNGDFQCIKERLSKVAGKVKERNDQVICLVALEEEHASKLTTPVLVNALVKIEPSVYKGKKNILKLFTNRELSNLLATSALKKKTVKVPDGDWETTRLTKGDVSLLRAINVAGK